MIRNKVVTIGSKTFSYARPQPADVVQFGAPIHALQSLRDTFVLGVVPTVGQEINLSILLKSILRGKFGRWGYYATYFEFVGAKLVLCWHDTLTETYLLRNYLGIPVFVIQNGIRSNVSAVGGASFRDSLRSVSIQKPRVDKYFSFNQRSSESLHGLFRSEFVPVGSYRLNDYARSAPTPRREKTGSRQSLVLMTSLPSRSTLPDSDLDKCDAPFIGVSDRIISFSEWFSPEARIAKALSIFCNSHELTFRILSKRSASDSIDDDYFEKCAGIERSAVITHEKGLGYEIADQFDYLVTIDSTIGYEMLALGKRVGFLSNRLRMIGVDSDELTFAEDMGWGKDGPFWTSAVTEEGIVRFLTRFIEISEAEWRTYRETLVPNLMRLDPGNSVIRSHIRSVLSSSR